MPDFVGLAGADGTNLAVVPQNSSRRRNGGVLRAARIVAQVDDVTLELIGRDLSRDVAYRLLQLLGHVVGERADANVADIAAFHLGADRAS